MADIRRRTEKANRSRLALWMLKVDKRATVTVKNTAALLRATGGEIALRTPFGKYATDLSKKVDANQSIVVGTNPLKQACGSTLQLSSGFGKWMPDTTT